MASSSTSAASAAGEEQDQGYFPLCVRFNQTGGCFACGTESGFRVYNCDPFKETIRRNFAQKRSSLCMIGGVRIIEMLFRSNLFAIVFHPGEKVYIWDDHQEVFIGELTFHTQVLGVRLRRDKIVVVLAQKIFIYNFEDLKLLKQLESTDNPSGLVCLSCCDDSILVCPGLQPGQIRIEHLGHRRSNFIKNAHTSNLACLALSLDGYMVASASEKGTLIRVWRTVDCGLEQELRRGSDRAEIYSIAFSPSNSWVAASSSKGTVHIWPTKKSQEDPNPVQSPTRVISKFSSFLPAYFHSKWSLAQYRLGDDTHSEVTFGTKDNTLIIITCSGKFHKVQFDIAGGECKKISFCKFFS